MKFSIGGEYEVSTETFWNHVFFRDDFTHALYFDGLGFERVEILDTSLAETGDRTRHLLVQPRLNIPRLIRGRIGDRLTYVEEGQFDAKRQRWQTVLRLKGWEDKVKIRSEMSFTDIGRNHALRHVEFDIEARVMGLGRLVERFLEGTLRESYEDARMMTNMWIRTHIADELRR
ncbi:MAG: DUF2505 family protein [Myxococcota bacterium]|nr:DUF2505 family protein [Myxococcota bacterium]